MNEKIRKRIFKCRKVASIVNLLLNYYFVVFVFCQIYKKKLLLLLNLFIFLKVNLNITALPYKKKPLKILEISFQKKKITGC